MLARMAGSFFGGGRLVPLLFFNVRLFGTKAPHDSRQVASACRTQGIAKLPDGVVPTEPHKRVAVQFAQADSPRYGRRRTPELSADLLPVAGYVLGNQSLVGGRQIIYQGFPTYQRKAGPFTWKRTGQMLASGGARV